MEERLLKTPAKDLTDAEAFDLLMFLYEQGEVQLPDGVRLDPRDPDKILSPKPGQQLRVGTVMGEVTYRRANDLKRPAGGPEGSDEMASFNPTPAFAVLLYRLGVFLHEQWDVDTIVCGGVGSGGGRAATDCHTQGRCVDFYGVVRAGDTIDVHRDWFARPVYQTRPDAKGRRGTLQAVGDDKWGGETATYFRLAFSPELQDFLPYLFFSTVWEFVTKECTTSAGDLSADDFKSGVLLGRGTIYHPDFPDWGSYTPGHAGRQSHHDHMHFQIGNAY
jgi:hypothetical protein